jgi:hypothetical protein
MRLIASTSARSDSRVNRRRWFLSFSINLVRVDRAVTDARVGETLALAEARFRKGVFPANVIPLVGMKRVCKHAIRGEAARSKRVDPEFGEGQLWPPWAV